MFAGHVLEIIRKVILGGQYIGLLAREASESREARE